ncbi:2-methoxy-6-polyprenyl-1,4-benzoquinol methylase, mitochondrial [Streptomyces badius]
MNGRVTRASLEKQPHEVASMFDGVAANYDLTNDVISLGQARLWRKAVAAAVDARPAQKILDLAAGTATSSQPFVKAGAYVVPCDFSLGMLKVGKERHPWMPFTAGDGMRLPFKDETFDTVTISFGLRNIQDTWMSPCAGAVPGDRPGGRVVICELLPGHDLDPFGMGDGTSQRRPAACLNSSVRLQGAGLARGPRGLVRARCRRTGATPPRT